jgi:DNA-binding transcriptional MocR family regulator
MDLHVTLVGRRNPSDQIYRQIRTHILERGLRPGDAVPSSRDLIARVLLAPGDVVAVEDPGYPPAAMLFRSQRCDLVGVPVDDEGLLVSAIPARPG